MDTAFSVPSRQLFIGNLSSWIAEKDLHMHFGQFGEIERYGGAIESILFRTRVFYPSFTLQFQRSTTSSLPRRISSQQHQVLLSPPLWLPRVS